MAKQPSSQGFVSRHIGIDEAQEQSMLQKIGLNTLDQLLDETIPASIRMTEELNIPVAQSEFEYLNTLAEVASKNRVMKSMIGQGYYGTITPSVLLRNIFQNPGWYTQYTPYQAEISQGRLEALLNFQTMLCDLTGMPLANASLLDEGTAAAEAMIMFYGLANKSSKAEERKEFIVASEVFDQTIDVIKTRAKGFGISVRIEAVEDITLDEKVFGVLLQYPDAEGCVRDYSGLAAEAKSKNIYVTAAADLMSLILLKSPAEWGADAVVGNTQRFGVPMGYGGPHAAYFATKEEFKRKIPGRIIGVSVDKKENPALRMALQTREQHIKRERATSNICTAQALLATMAGMYAVYHGPERLKNIASQINQLAYKLIRELKNHKCEVKHQEVFDTICINVDASSFGSLKELSEAAGYNFYYGKDTVQMSFDETHNASDVAEIIRILLEAGVIASLNGVRTESLSLTPDLFRSDEILTHPVFNTYHTETRMMRYLKRLENKDLSLTHAMIPLGSCTMKLNAATQLIPVSWSEFSTMHPFAPAEQTGAYAQIIEELENYLAEITGFTACSLQPNSGAQGEYAGLMCIKAYHEANGNDDRVVALIPASAHGTNPASAVMAGMKVVVVKCDEQGNIDVADLREKAALHTAQLASLMITYPSTHGVFEEEIIEICKIVHDNGGLVYMDGANMNAQVGLTNPGIIGADVCHLNLHKTFSIPHGGGGPGMGPICVNDKLKDFLPSHPSVKVGGVHGINAISAAPWGSASILLISYAYIRLLGSKGVKDASRYAILNANYIAECLRSDYEILYTNEKSRVAHELIIDVRPFKEFVSAEDVAKRIIDFGFHPPTLSFPVPGTIMIEPTESEDKDEIDRFIETMKIIREEIREIEQGNYPKDDNVLVNAPHTQQDLLGDWEHAYSLEKAVFPSNYQKEVFKFWPSVSRVNNAVGDRNLICTCPDISSYEEEVQTS